MSSRLSLPGVDLSALQAPDKTMPSVLMSWTLARPLIVIDLPASSDVPFDVMTTDDLGFLRRAELDVDARLPLSICCPYAI